MLTIGSTLHVTIEGISLDGGKVVMVCRDSAGGVWQMAHGPAMAPSSPAKAPAVSAPNGAFTRLEALQGEAGPHSAPIEATTDPGRLAPVPPATPWSSVDDIAAYIYANPRMISRFTGSMTLHKRQLVGKALIGLGGVKLQETVAFQQLVSTGPAPDLEENAKKNKATWGADNSVGKNIVGIANFDNHHRKTERQTVVVDEFLAACRGQYRSRADAQTLAAKFAAEVEG